MKTSRPQMIETRSRPPGRSGSLLALLMVSGCILTDLDIDYRAPNPNDNAVRFYEAAPMTVADRCDCEDGLKLEGDDRTCNEGDPAESRGGGCPIPDLPGLPRFMSPAVDAYDFCGCPDGERDSRALPLIDDILGEDLGLDDDNSSPKDEIYAVALLDLSNDPRKDAFNSVAYRILLDPENPLGDEEASDHIANWGYLNRPQPRLRRVVLGHPQFGTVDLCNDAGTTRLSEGWHTLTLMVTDRPWVTQSSDAGPEISKAGVPDIVANATWDTRQYVFRCTNAENNPDCLCEVPQ